jgi:hypothetical protein
LVLFCTLASFWFNFVLSCFVLLLVAPNKLFFAFLFVLVALCVYDFVFVNGPCFILLLCLVVLSCCSILRYLFSLLLIHLACCFALLVVFVFRSC